SHRAARGKSGDEDAARIDVVILDHARDHLADRGYLAASARDVLRVEPVEAAMGIVRGLLLRKQHGKPIMMRERGPAGAAVITGRVLTAAMQDDDQRTMLDVFGYEGEHAQGTRIRSEIPGFNQRAFDIRTQ